MKIDATRLGLAAAIIAALSWSICSLLVFAAPRRMMGLGGHMIHTDPASLDWTLTFAGFMAGLVGWSMISGLIVWSLAALYNRLLG